MMRLGISDVGAVFTVGSTRAEASDAGQQPRRSRYVVREVDMHSELDRVVDLMNANFPDPVSRARFEWLYLASPEGRATAWFVVDQQTGTPVGSTAVFPRRVRLCTGEIVRAWLCGDFSVLKAHRTLGVAAKLRRAAKDAVDAGVVPFLFAHPNDRMLAVHLTVGHGKLGQIVRYAKPLRTRTGWAGVDAASAVAFRALDLMRLPRVNVDDEWRGRAEFDEEFTRLFERVPLGRTAVVRDAPYLNWRFLQNPNERAEVLAIRRDSTLQGYVVLAASDDIVTVKDWLGVDSASVEQLFSVLVHGMRRRGVASVSLGVLAGHPDLPVLQRLGFRLRPGSSRAAVYAPPRWRSAADVVDPSRWYMTIGDRDV